MTGLFLLAVAVIGIVLITNPATSSFDEKNVRIRANEDLLKKHVEKIVDTEPPRNYLNTQSLDKVAEYIKSELEKYCPDVNEQPYAVDGREYKNVVCGFSGKSEERIVIGAHYDVYGEQDGADDNASGVAAMLELARMLKVSGAVPNYRLDLVAFTLEEPPYFKTEGMGSAVYAKSLHDRGADVKLMISLESIGYFTETAGSQAYPAPLLRLFYPSVGNFIAIVGDAGTWFAVRSFKSLMARASAVPVYSVNFPAFMPGIDFSDHYSFRRYGYPAVMITDTALYRNANYHTPGDVVGTLDFSKLKSVVEGVFLAVTELR